MGRARRRKRECPAVDARAAPHRLTITTARGDSTFRVHARGLTAAAILRERWALSGLMIAVETDAANVPVTPVSPDEFDVTYRAATRFLLRTSIPSSSLSP